MRVTPIFYPCIRLAISRCHRRPAVTRRVIHCLLHNCPVISRCHRCPAVTRRVKYSLLHNRPAAGRCHRPPSMTKRRRRFPTSLSLQHLMLYLWMMMLMTPSPQQVPVPGRGRWCTICRTARMRTPPSFSHQRRFVKFTCIMVNSGLWIRIRMDSHSFSLLDPDPHSICGSGSRRVNLSTKTEKMQGNC